MSSSKANNDLGKIMIFRHKANSETLLRKLLDSVTALAIRLFSLFLEATAKPTALESLPSKIGAHHQNYS